MKTAKQLTRHDQSAWVRQIRAWADRIDARAERMQDRAEELREAATRIENGEKVDLVNLNGAGPVAI